MMLTHMFRAAMLVLLALLLANCGPQAPAPAPAPGDEIQFQGTVVDTIDDCAFDGTCALVVETDTGRYTAVWAEGMRQCAGDYAGGVVIGDEVEVFGNVQEDDRVSICDADTYSIHPLAEGGATR
jgi:hypothetical protein